MRKRLLGLSVILMLSTGFEVQLSDPEEVEVASSSGTFDAEILCVRESTLVMISPAGADEAFLKKNNQLIRVVRNDDIYSVKTNGSSHALVGALAGCLTGCTAGLVAGRQKEEEEREKLRTNPVAQIGYALTAAPVEVGAYVAGFTLGGALLGGAIGAATSSRDSVWVRPGHRDFTALKTLARYPYGEPYFLREITY